MLRFSSPEDMFYTPQKFYILGSVSGNRRSISCVNISKTSDVRRYKGSSAGKISLYYFNILVKSAIKIIHYVIVWIPPNVEEDLLTWWRSRSDGDDYLLHCFFSDHLNILPSFVDILLFNLWKNTSFASVRQRCILNVMGVVLRHFVRSCVGHGVWLNVVSIIYLIRKRSPLKLLPAGRECIPMRRQRKTLEGARLWSLDLLELRSPYLSIELSSQDTPKKSKTSGIAGSIVVKVKIVVRKHGRIYTCFGARDCIAMLWDPMRWQKMVMIVVVTSSSPLLFFHVGVNHVLRPFLIEIGAKVDEGCSYRLPCLLERKEYFAHSDSWFRLVHPISKGDAFLYSACSEKCIHWGHLVTTWWRTLCDS